MEDENKIGIIIYAHPENDCHDLLDDLSRLEIPEGFSVDVLLLKGTGSRADAYNQAVVSSPAKYKIYMEESCRITNCRLLTELVGFLKENKEVGCVGLYGSEMPIDGNFARSKKRFGIYGYRHGDEVQVIQGKNPLWKQHVHCIDDGLIATAHDVAWDADVREDFLAAAYCCRMRQQGYKIAVPMQNYPWCTFGKPSAYFADNGVDECFSAKYREIFQPLVSILIPTYNQPKFFSQALDSALAQDYQNIEIIVGDDSTNTQTKELMETKYLNQHSNIKYYCHGEPLGGNGLYNSIFLQNKANGEYINVLYHDDLFAPHKISRMMEVFSMDLNEEIGLVTSVRNKIDGEGRLLGRIGAWQPAADEVLPPEVLVDSILCRSTNYLGEMSTVLMRKEILEKSDGQIVGYCFCDIQDPGNGDIATFLEVAHKKKSVYFIKEALSQYREHEEQNTYRPEIIFHSIMAWLMYIVIAWQNKVGIYSEAQMHGYMDAWGKKHAANIKAIMQYENKDMSAMKEMLMESQMAVKNKDYKKLEQCAMDYMNIYCHNLEEAIGSWQCK